MSLTKTLSFLLSPRGRMSRGAYFLSMAALSAAFVGLVNLLLVVGDQLRATAFITEDDIDDAIFILVLMLGWVFFAINAKRMHDRGSSVFWLILGPLGVLTNFIVPGERGPNKYGADPLAMQRYEKMRKARERAARAEQGETATPPSKAGKEVALNGRFRRDRAAAQTFPKARSWPYAK